MVKGVRTHGKGARIKGRKIKGARLQAYKRIMTACVTIGLYLFGDWLQDGQIDGSLLATIAPYL